MTSAFHARREAAPSPSWRLGTADGARDSDSQPSSSQVDSHPAGSAVPIQGPTTFGLLAHRGRDGVRKLASVRILRYAAVGAGAAVLQLALLATFVEVFHVAALLASTAALSISVVVNYRLQHWLTFRSKSAHLVAGPRFIALTLVTLAANAGLFSLLVLVLPYLLSQIITTLAIFPINYFLNKTFTFRT